MKLVALMCLSSCLSGVSKRGELLIESTDTAYGASRMRFDVQARIDESLSIELVYPSDNDGNPAAGAPFPTIVFVQGGLVTAARYRWMAQHFATRGYVTVLPSHFAELAVLESDDARIALQSLEREARRNNLISGLVTEASPAVVMGHSLGGVVAGWNWITTERFSGLALLAAYPAAADDVHKRAGSPVLSIIGSADGRASLDTTRAGFERFADPRLFAIVEGMTHYDWTDGASPGELSSEGDPSRAQELTRADALHVIDAWLDAVLKQDAAALASLQGEFPNVQVER